MDEIHMPGRLLNEKEVLDTLKVKVAKPRRWRWAGRGPEFLKIEHVVRYDPADLDAFIAAARRRSTSDDGTTATAEAAV